MLFRSVGGDGSAKNTEREVGRRIAEGAAALIFSRTEQRGDGGGIAHGRSIDEHDVAADAEGGPRKGEGYCVVERGAGGHKCRRGDGAGVMQLGYGAVHAGRETEVVRIDDEASCHRDEMRRKECGRRSALCASLSHELTGRRRAADYAPDGSRACASDAEESRGEGKTNAGAHLSIWVWE